MKKIINGNKTNTIGSRLRKLREEQHMTQLRLGIKLNVVQETISGYEVGRAEPSLGVLVGLADELNASVDYILGRTEHPFMIKNTVLNANEIKMLHIFSALSFDMQEKILEILQLFMEA